MSANDRNAEQSQQEQVTDLPEQQPSEEQGDGVKGGMIYLGSPPPTPAPGIKYVPTMQTKDGGTSPLT